MFADDRRAQPVGGRLQLGHIVHRQESVVVFPQGNLLSLQFLLHERVAIEPAGGVKRKEARHAHDDGPQNLVPDVEVVMGEAAGLMRQDAVVGILRGILRHADPEPAALFHALEDEVDAESLPVLHAAVKMKESDCFRVSIV